MMSYRLPRKRKPKTCIIFIVFCLLGFYSNAQSGKFSLLTGNAEEIIASYLDRDSSQFFTLDKAGFIVVWDVESLVPIRRFPTVPLHPFYADRTDVMTVYPTLKVNKNSLWITHHTITDLGNVFSDVYSKKGRFYGSTDTGYVRRIHYLNNNDFVVTHCSEIPFWDNGRNIHGYLALQKAGDTAFISMPLDKVATTIEDSPGERYLAVGYKRGGVDLVSVDGFNKILRSQPGGGKPFDYVNAVKFLPDNKGFLYSFFFETKKLYVQYMDETAPREIELPEASAQVKMEVSPSGRYVALLLDQMHIWIYDLVENKFANSRAITKTDRVNAVYFLTDDMLLTSGNSRHAKVGFYSYLAGEASIQKLDWKENLWSDNFSYDPLTAALHNADITVLNDSVYQLTQTNKWQYQLTPSNLRNSYFSSDNYLSLNRAAASFGYKQKGFPGESGLIINDSDSSFIWSALPVDSFKVLLLKQKIENENFIDAYPVKNFVDYKLTRIHASRRLALWTKETFTPGQLDFFIADASGKVLFSSRSSSLFANAFRFSPLGSWFCYQEYNQTHLTLVSLGKTSTKKTIHTGRNNPFSTGAKLQFIEDTKVVYEALGNDSSQSIAFSMVVQNLINGTRDTLISLGVKPYAYALDNDRKKFVAYYPVDITDSLAFTDPEKVAKAAKYGFRTIYNPVIILYDLVRGGKQVIPVFNKIPIEKLAIMGDKIIALQKDGLINYYRAVTGRSLALHWLRQKEQVVMDSSYYYATAGMVPDLFLQGQENVLPAGQWDIVYNNPAALMKVLGSSNQSLAGLYQRAYEKRIKQTAAPFPAKPFSAVPVLKPDMKASRQLLVKDSIIHYTINLRQTGAAIKRILAKVNDFPVYGKEGLQVPKDAEDITLSLPLDSGYNNIRIQVVDQDNQSSAPVRLTYYARYNKPAGKRKLWILSAGVSNYADSLNNLKYAAKDATDFARVFSYKNNFDTIIIHTLTNEQVRSSAITDALKKVSASKNDVVIVYLAGHGLLDGDANFYFATHDIDFRNPGEKGLSYTTLLSSMEGLPAKQKLLFLDACHSGVVDRSMFRKTEIVAKNTGTALLRQGARGGVLLKSGKQDYKEQDVFLFMQKVFADFSQDNSTNILAASLGNSYALENSQLQNGLFTYSIIKGLGLAKASRKEFYSSDKEYAEGSVISISDLQEYLASEVLLLSKGAQVPSFRVNKTISDKIIFGEGSFPGYLFSSFDEKAAAYKAFLDRYKTQDD